MEKMAVMVELDYCVGCFACQTACQEYNGLPVKETYLRCVLTKPERVDGDIVSHMSAVPLSLMRCAECTERNGGAPCARICIGDALHIGPKGDIMEKASETTGKIALYA